jgi:hypothetical protein
MDPTNSPSEAEENDCTFSYNTPGTVSLSIEIIDSVLYSTTSNSLQISLAAPAINAKPTISPGTTTGSNTLAVTWTPNSTDNYTCTFNNLTETIDATSNSDSCTALYTSATTSVNIIVTDTSGNQATYTDTAKL